MDSSAARIVVLPVMPKQPNAVPPMENIVALPVGTRLFEFEITRLIGGIVYAAHDHSLDREVAVKEYMPSSLALRTDSHAVSVRSDRLRILSTLA